MTVDAGGILVVDDEALIAMGLSMALNQMGWTVCGTAGTGARAVELAMTHRPRLVLMDVRLRGDMDGVDAALRIHTALGVPVIFITGSREPETLDRIRQDHPADILFKPILPHHLKSAVERILPGSPA